MAYWLFKSEPSVFSYDDLVKKGKGGTQWDGVRNYQARNNMRAMKIGDLVLTCGSGQSRNFAYGQALGSGQRLERLKLAEGVATAGIAARIAAERGIEAPITSAVDRMLAGELRIRDAVDELFARPLKPEIE